MALACFLPLYISSRTRIRKDKTLFGASPEVERVKHEQGSIWQNTKQCLLLSVNKQFPGCFTPVPGRGLSPP